MSNKNPMFYKDRRRGPQAGIEVLSDAEISKWWNSVKHLSYNPWQGWDFHQFGAKVPYHYGKNSQWGK